MYQSEEVNATQRDRLSTRERKIAESSKLMSLSFDMDYYGVIYCQETIRQGKELSKTRIASLYASEFALQSVLSQSQLIMARIHNSFLHRIKDQITDEFCYHSYASGKIYHIYIYS